MILSKTELNLCAQELSGTSTGKFACERLLEWIEPEIGTLSDDQLDCLFHLIGAALEDREMVVRLVRGEVSP